MLRRGKRADLAHTGGPKVFGCMIALVTSAYDGSETALNQRYAEVVTAEVLPSPAIT